MTYLHIHLSINTSFHPIHNHRKFSLNFLHSFFVLIPQKLVDSNFSFFFVRTWSSPGILALPLLSSSPDISLQTKAKRLDTTNVFRNLLNGARINEIKKERKKRKKEIKKAQGGSQRTEETKLLLLPPPIPLVSRVQVLSMIPRRRSTTDYRVSLLLEGRENKLVNDFKPAMNLRGKLSRIMHTFRRIHVLC